MYKFANNYPSRYFVSRANRRAWEWCNNPTGIEHAIYGTYNTVTRKQHLWRRPMLFRSDETFFAATLRIYAQHPGVNIMANHR